MRRGMELISAPGKLLLIGGGEDKEGDCAILKEFVRLSEGAKARVALMTVATDHPKESGAEYMSDRKHFCAEAGTDKDD